MIYYYQHVTEEGVSEFILETLIEASNNIYSLEVHDYRGCTYEQMQAISEDLDVSDVIRWGTEIEERTFCGNPI